MEEVGYKVDFDALDMLGGGINIKVNEWLEALNSLETAASALASSGNITGVGAHNMKAYFSYVYPSVLASLRQILAAHAQNFLLYKQDYQSNIDTATHAVICQEEILDIKAQIEENKNKAAAVDTSIQNALSKVNDILYTGFRGYGSALETSSTITRNITELDADICALENRHMNADFEAVGRLIDNLSAFLKNQLAKTRDYKSGFSVDSLASDPSYTALAMSFGTLVEEQSAKADALELAGQQEQARIEVLQKEYEQRKKEAEAVNWLVTGLCVVGSIVAIAATGGAATPLVVAGISAVSGTVIAGTHSITGQYVQTGDLGKTDWMAVGKNAFIGGVSGFVTGYLGAGISNVVTSRLGSTVIGNTLLNSSSTVTRVATNAFIGAGSETVSGIGTRFAGTMITSGGDIEESFGSAFDVHNIAFDAAFGSVFGGVRGFKQPTFADGMSPEDAKRYNQWMEQREAGLDIEVLNDVVLTNKPSRPDPTTYLSQDYIDTHLLQFDDGVSVIQTEWAYGRYSETNGFVGVPDDNTLFVLPKDYCDDVISRANGDISVIEKELGFPEGYFSEGGGLVRIDANDISGLNIRIPCGNETGANNLWIPGGYTSGGVPEAITDTIPLDRVSVTRINVD